MARSRSYSARFAGVSVSAVQDLLAIYSGANMAFELHGFEIGQITLSTVELLNLSVKRLPTTVTAGTGGSAPTPQRMMRGDAAASVTARANDATTQATTSGTAAVLHSDVVNLVNGYQFFWPPDDRPTFGLNEAAILSLDTAPAAARVMSGTIYFGELF